MADKRYYYMKLKEDFFDSEEMKILESMENGYLYSNILLKMYLKALKNEGQLIFNDYIPYNAKMLSTITGHNIDVVEKALVIFQQLHLIEKLDNGTIYMLDIQKLIGSITTEGIRKAEYRERINKEKDSCGTLSQTCPDIISYSNYNSISNNKEEREINKEKENIIKESFDLVWSKHPRKVNKQLAIKSWNKKFKNIKDIALIEEKIEKIKELYKVSYMDWKKRNTELEYIPHFSSWLNANIPD